MKSLKANEKAVLKDIRSLGFSNKDIQEMTDTTKGAYSELLTVRVKTEDMNKLEAKLLDVSRQLERQTNQTEKLNQLFQHLRKQTQIAQKQTEIVNNMNKQMKQIQKEISSVRKGIQQVQKQK